MKKIIIVMLMVLLTMNIAFAQNRNLNPDPNGPEWIVGGLRELTEKDWEFLNSLPELKKGEKLNLKKLDANQSFTKPPARYSEAMLVKRLEADGIGRPSTYASIISTYTFSDNSKQLF